MTKTITLTETEVILLDDLLFWAGENFEADNAAAGQDFAATLLILRNKLGDGATVTEFDPFDEWMADMRMNPPAKVH